MIVENPSVNLADPALFINREISLLEFNKRCLEEALDTTLPLLERIRFLAIFSNNLDEFFMVRVSGLRDQVTSGVIDTSPDGLTPEQQLRAIRERVTAMLEIQRACLHDDLLPKLVEQGIHVLRYEQLNADQRTVLRHYFEAEVFPVLTPLAVDPGRPFPHISNLSINLAVTVSDEAGHERFARIKVPSSVNRLVSINEAQRKYGNDDTEQGVHRFVWLEELIAANLDLLFPGTKITATGLFRIIRNTDMEIAEDEASDLLETIEEGVKQRRFGQVVQMSVIETMPNHLVEMLVENLDLDYDDVYFTPSPLGMSDLFALANIDVPALKYPTYIAPRSPSFPSTEDVFTAIRRQDILMHRPYESFQPTIEFFQQAA